MIDGKNFFDQPINSMARTYENIRKTTKGKGDDYTTGCLLEYSYFKNHYKMIAIDLSKQQALDADPRAIQQINFTVKIEQEIQQCSLLLKKQKKLFWTFHKELQKFCKCNFIECNFMEYKVHFNFYQYKNDTIQQFKRKAIKFTAS